MAANIEANTPYEALFDAFYWEQVRTQLKIGDFIRCFPDDSSYVADLMVRDVGEHGTRVEEFYKKDMKPLEDKQGGIFEFYLIRFRGPQLKWAVVHKDTDKTVKDGFSDEMAAMRWLMSNAKQLAGTLKGAA